MASVQYIFDNTDLAGLGLIVKSSDGVLSQPDFKTPTSHDWKESHGTMVDLSARRLRDRTIKLVGYIVGDNPADLTNKVQQLFNVLSGNGMHMLRIIVPNANAPLFFQVYLQKKIDVKKQWKPNGPNVGELTIELTEPEPVKRVISFGASITTASIKMNTNGEAVNIRYSDGFAQLDAITSGTQTITHRFSTTGEHFAIITGNIDAITDYTTNGQTTWSKL